MRSFSFAQSVFLVSILFAGRVAADPLQSAETKKVNGFSSDAQEWPCDWSLMSFDRHTEEMELISASEGRIECLNERFAFRTFDVSADFLVKNERAGGGLVFSSKRDYSDFYCVVVFPGKREYWVEQVLNNNDHRTIIGPAFDKAIKAVGSPNLIRVTGTQDGFTIFINEKRVFEFKNSSNSKFPWTARSPGYVGLLGESRSGQSTILFKDFRVEGTVP